MRSKYFDYSVSLREVDRFQKLLSFFLEMIEQKLNISEQELNSKNVDVKKINKHYFEEGKDQKMERAVVLSLAMVYMGRLDTQSNRSEYR